MSNLEAVTGIFADDTKKATELQARYKEAHDQLRIHEAVAIVHEQGEDPSATYMGISKKKGAGAGLVADAFFVNVRQVLDLLAIIKGHS